MSRAISKATAARLIHFDRGGEGNTTGPGHLQLEGAVALYNLLLRNRFAYLADEVGMGKTYVALGAAALLRHFNPGSRLMVLAPRENIQRKWIKELRNFVAVNWQVEDGRVRGFDGRPARELVSCGSLPDLARECTLSQQQDLFVRMTSFSPQLGGRDNASAATGMGRARDRLCAALPHLSSNRLDLRVTHERFRDEYGRLINATLSPIDLLIVDEAHNYRHGYTPRTALRNHLTALTFGHPRGAEPGHPTYGPRIQRLLLLSATPFEYDYADLYRQLDVFGFGDATVLGADGGAIGGLGILRDSGVDEQQKRQLVSQFMIRRVAGLEIGGELHTKNMYRREWRRGGFETHDEPMEITDPKQRLIVALVQKKVAEVLGSERFNNRFQIGMLSSFESFLQSSTRSSVKLRDDGAGEDEEESERVFDGEQADLEDEVRKGIDARPLARLLRSYKKRFGHALPHPKLDTAVAELGKAFETGHKTLVFVRRIATMDELAARLHDRYDAWLHTYMRRQLPGMEPRVDEQFARYREDKHGGKSSAPTIADADDGDGIYGQDEDRGGSESFFAWFFRGKDNRGVLSGAAFQKNRLIKPSSAYASLFEDDHVAALLGRPADVLGTLADATGNERSAVVDLLRAQAFRLFAGRRRRAEGYPRFDVLEAYQIAGLSLLESQAGDDELRGRARVVRQESFGVRHELERPVPAGFPGPEQALGVTTFVTLLHEPEHAGLREVLLPSPAVAREFSLDFREREQRRELLSALSRLGSSYVDLYLLAIRRIGGFEMSRTAKSGDEEPAVELARDFLALLEAQLAATHEQRPGLPGFHAFHELSGAAEAFHDIMATNFPEVRHQPLWELRRDFGRVLQHQSPVATSSRSKVKRLVQQFRMPGYPLVLVTTDILQEGEDLHTFCAKVVHYGITWTPSGMEQRTGRVDRIGSLTQRRLDQRDVAHDDQMIQVYYPHLQDTVEVLQVERVLARLNRFIRMVHSNAEPRDSQARQIDAGRELVRERPEIEPIRHRLRSAFDIDPGWLEGENRPMYGQVQLVDLLDHFAAAWEHVRQSDASKLHTLAETGLIHNRPSGYVATARVSEVETVPVRVSIVPQRGGPHALLRVAVEVAELDLDDPETVDLLADIQRRHGGVKLWIEQHEKRRSWQVWSRREALFHPNTSQFGEVLTLVVETVEAAVELRSAVGERAG